MKNVQVLGQTETSITLKWKKVDTVSTYILKYNSTKEENVNSPVGESVTHEISNLTPGTKYNFTIITKFEDFESTGYSVEAVTSKRVQANHSIAFLFVNFF